MTPDENGNGNHNGNHNGDGNEGRNLEVLFGDGEPDDSDDVPEKVILCPHCGSDDFLPFESDNQKPMESSLFVIFASAFLVIGIYLFFMVSSYLYFPFVLFGFIILAARLVNRREKRRKLEARREWDYLCTDCGRSFHM